MNLGLFRPILYRNPEANKYEFGHVLVVGGSPGTVGAPLLVAEAAERTGAGLVTIASAPDVIDKLEEHVTEIMTQRITYDKNHGVNDLLEFIKERKVSVVAIGSGMPEEAHSFIREVISKIEIPIIVDASAILAYKDHLCDLEKFKSDDPKLIFTPHYGEFCKLIPSATSANWHNKAKEFSKKYNVVIVCKGDNSLVLGPKGQLNINSTGNPGLATAGSGDVLDGMIAGLIAQDMSLFDAAKAGVYLHGLSADLAIRDVTEPAMIASDIINYIPKAYKQILSRLT